MQQPVRSAVANPAIAEWRMYIDGALVEASLGRCFDNIDPFTEQSIGVTADERGAAGAYATQRDRAALRRRAPRRAAAGAGPDRSAAAGCRLSSMTIDVAVDLKPAVPSHVWHSAGLGRGQT